MITNSLDFNYKTFKMLLADKRINIRYRYERTINFCRNYLSRFEIADINIIVTEKDYQDQYAKLPPIEHTLEGVATCRCNDNLEKIIVCRKIADAMIEHDTVLIHSAAIAINNKCYLFTAPSGTGKTTHILNWKRAFPETIIVNGDKPFINVTRRTVFGTPWCGKEGFNTNTAAPLAGIIALERDHRNSIQPLEFKEMFPILISQTYIPANSECAINAYRLIGKLKNTPCYRLKCNKSEESAIIACNGIREYEAILSNKQATILT